MARKRQRQRRAQQSTSAADQQAHYATNNTTNGGHDGNGVTVNIRQIGKSDEGVLYTHKITERPYHPKRGALSRLFQRRSRHISDNVSISSGGDLGLPRYRRSISAASNGNSNIVGSMVSQTPRSPPPRTDTLMGFRTFYGKHQKQYTIASKKKYKNNLLNWFDKHHMNFVEYFCHANEVENNVYRPSTSLYRYIDWTFTATFTSVFISFLMIYLVLCVLFGALLLWAGNAEPNCIVASGEPFGKSDNPKTAWSDAFALSWTTFTTVGYGMTYTTTASDFNGTKPHECSWVVFLSTTEAFLGLLFAGMCAALLFGKVNRVQSHANIIFANAVCLQYEEMEEDNFEGPDTIDSERSAPTPSFSPIPVPDLDDEENQLDTAPQSQIETKFVDQFNGCPVLKFQVVNELCNREGGELVDCMMKVVGIKFKGPNGKVTHSQYVRVNLVDFEHPFLSRVWHGVHILDSTSPLLTDRARQRIRENKGSWPGNWFDPEIIRSKLEFHDLIVTVAGISNVSAVTVHAYKRYMIGDVLIGFNFAPIVFRDVETGALDVEISMCHDVREQYGIEGEDLSIRRDGSNEFETDRVSGRGSFLRDNLLRESTIRIKRSKSGDCIASVTSHQSHHEGDGFSIKSKPTLSFASPQSSRAPSPVASPIGSPTNSARDITEKAVNEPMISPLDDSESEDEEPEQEASPIGSPTNSARDITEKSVNEPMICSLDDSESEDEQPEQSVPQNSVIKE